MNSTINNFQIVYAAKPTYGGWVSCTAHLSKSTNSPIFKIARRSEQRQRDFGYQCTYQNKNIEDFSSYLTTLNSDITSLLLIAVDHHFYEKIASLIEKCQHLIKIKIIIHDPTELAGKKSLPLLQLLRQNSEIEIITIRPRVQQHLSDQYSLNSTLKHHPFYRFPLIANKKVAKKANQYCKIVAMARIDHDKHTDIIVEANSQLPLDQKITIYGAVNGFYAYKKLYHFDSMKTKDPDSMYQGTYKKDWNTIQEIVSSYDYIIDLSIIKNDGGHTQYTFLEAIYLSKVLILHRRWVTGKDSIWVEGVNCLAVDSVSELCRLVKNPLSAEKYQEIITNSLEIIGPCFKNWSNLI